MSSARDFADSQGTRWRAELISHGRTSGYLNPRVHQAVLQFTCLDDRRPRRYVGFPAEAGASLSECANADLCELLLRASAH